MVAVWEIVRAVAFTVREGLYVFEFAPCVDSYVFTTCVGIGNGDIHGDGNKI